MAITRLTKNEDLLASLTEGGIPHKDDGQGGIEMRAPNGDMIYLRWERGLPYIQVIYPFIAGVPDDRIRDVESAICRVNNVIKLPGFGFAEDHRLIYMRLCVQLEDDGGIGAAAFARQVGAVFQNASEFAAAFRDVVAGAPGKDITELAIKHNQKPGQG